VNYPDMSVFGHDPWWLMLAKALGIFVFLLLTVLVAILVERKLLGRMQMRYGPNRLGPFGLLQSLADGIKLALKEGLVPAGVDKPLYLLAPVISVVTAILGFAVMPLGPVVSVFGHQTPLQLTDLPVGVLYVLAITSIGVYGIVLAGWASGSTYPLLGGLRREQVIVVHGLRFPNGIATGEPIPGLMGFRQMLLVARLERVNDPLPRLAGQDLGQRVIGGLGRVALREEVADGVRGWALEAGLGGAEGAGEALDAVLHRTRSARGVDVSRETF
jgi:hypothetical protein